MFILLCSFSVNKCKENLVGLYCKYPILKLFSCFAYTTVQLIESLLFHAVDDMYM